MGLAPYEPYLGVPPAAGPPSAQLAPPAAGGEAHQDTRPAARQPER
jgi:hypothetical protein